MDNFFSNEDYKIPTTSNYMKFQEGENSFRVLSSAVIGYEYFNNENKPVRSKDPFDEMPVDMKKDGAIKHFWAFVVFNHEDKRIQILEVTQKGIMNTMMSYIKNPKWGSPREYDFIVTRKGSGLDTEYTVAVNPKSEIGGDVMERYQKLKIDLNALFTGKDPFNAE